MSRNRLVAHDSPREYLRGSAVPCRTYGSGITAVGIDVGGPRKGFHAVALCGGDYFAKFAAHEPAAMRDWCRSLGALAIGIDAPCRWSANGRARSAESLLAAVGIHAFATPAEEVAQKRSFYRWMLNGAELFQCIEQHYALFGGGRSWAQPVCFETFPQAVACALAGRIVSAKRKGSVRREVLTQVGIDTGPLTNIDTVDAALCAFTAHQFLGGNFVAYGDAEEGFIIVPGRCTADVEASDG